ncbi:hypothetical protein CEK71_16440 [Methylovulum psychrotolerans]|uniref:Uncharacterized protein n=1 Tax=Methylovulum psychrotolerans TaxID=1704499 RepID=A0A1Z4C1W2_9GAMM|nr:hypothetical protein CEK71_16440 [Methylovulum psychrotolerans]
MPRRASQVLSGSARIPIGHKGARQGCRASAEGQEAPSAYPRQNREAQEEAATGPPFLWILSFRLQGCTPSGA